MRAVAVAILVAVALTAVPSPHPVRAADVDTTIREKCAQDWPADFVMRAHCEKRQREALSALSAPVPVPATYADTIRNKCAAEWPTDFVMRAHCERRQAEAVRQLNLR